MSASLDSREAEKAAGEANEAQIPISPSKEDGESAKKKKGSNGFLRVFTFGDNKIYVLECIAVMAAIASGVALAMVNLVMGQFFTLLGDFSISDANSMPDNFMFAVRTSALYFVYIGVARLVATYIYASLFTYVEGVDLRLPIDETE